MGHRIFQMSFASVYGALIAKAERKGRTRAEVDDVTEWLLGYSAAELDRLLQDEVTYVEFLTQAPALNPNRRLITGKICGVRVEEIEEPTMQVLRQLDKLVDELAKGRPMDKILRQA